ncbi:MAG: radical SAM protein [Phycisphaerales bacterium]|nr:radical SAM protein [Phycisphaerales bacterium]
MPARTVYLETFGCQMNELDSELVAGRLASLGYRLTSASDEADIVLYNTCSVREHAEQKVWSRLGDLKAKKMERPGLVVGVLGCMAERDGQALMKRMPVVDVMCGPGELDKLPELLDNAVRTRLSLLADEQTAMSAGARSAGVAALQGNASRRSSTLSVANDSLEMLDLSRSVSPIDSQAKASAYVRITRGCNKFCTYCVVPFTRGAEVHRPPAHIVDECKRLVDAGVREITLLGQTVNHYRFEHDAALVIDGIVQPQKGRSYKGGANGHRRDPFAGERVTTFADLLYQIHEQVPDLPRLRFVTSYPRDFGDDVLEVIRDCPRICRYIHAPAQSGSDRQLALMNRGYTVAEYDEFIQRCREHLDQPEIGRPLMLSGDMIVGFSGESDEDFALSVDLLRRSRYKNCFIFKYSPRPGTTAFDRLPDDVPEEVKRRRNNELLAVQAEVSDAVSREQVGRTFDVMIEGISRRERKRRGVDVKPGGGMIELTVGGRSSAAAVLAEAAADASGLNGQGESVQLSGRTDGDQIVFIELAPHESSRAEGLIGHIARVSIDRAERLSLFGRLEA